MALVKKCNLCNAKSVFLKLNNGLCSDCEKELRVNEMKYSEILQHIAQNPSNKLQYAYELLGLLPEFSRFYKYSSIINEPLVLNLVGEINNSPKASVSKAPSLDIYSIGSDNNSINISKEEITNVPTEITGDTSEPIEIPMVESPPPPVVNPSDKVIIDQLYDNTLNLITKLSNPTLDLNELGRGYFSLKDSFYPLLKKYNISEVNGENVGDFLSIIQRKLCHRTSQTPDTLYGFFNYIAVAIQTTGARVDMADIIEISAIKISYNDIVDEYYTLVNPLKSIKLAVEKSTGINSNMVASEHPIDIILPNFIEFIGTFKLITHNSNYTLGFLNYYDLKLFHHEIKNQNECILKLYRSKYKGYHGEPPRYSDLHSICLGTLSTSEIHAIDVIPSISKSSSLAIYKVYESLKYK